MKLSDVVLMTAEEVSQVVAVGYFLAVLADCVIGWVFEGLIFQ